MRRCTLEQAAFESVMLEMGLSGSECISVRVTAQPVEHVLVEAPVLEIHLRVQKVGGLHGHGGRVGLQR